MEAEFTAELENYNQKHFLVQTLFAGLIEKNIPKMPSTQKSPIFKQKNFEKSKVKCLFLFF